MQVYAPHTGNPNVWKAREQGIPGVLQWPSAPQVNPAGTPSTMSTPLPPVPALGNNVPSTTPAFSSAQQQFTNEMLSWRSSFSGTFNPAQSISDTSGDEVDSDDNAMEAWRSPPFGQQQRASVSSLDSQESSSVYSFATASSPQPWSNTGNLMSSTATGSVSNLPLDAPPLSDVLAQTSFSSVQEPPAPPARPAVPALNLSEPMLDPATSGSTANTKTPVAAWPQQKTEWSGSTSSRDDPVNMFAPAPSATTHGTRPDAPQLSRLRTQGLGKQSSSTRLLSIPSTPMRLGNLSMFSPDQPSTVLGNMDLSSWLDEPVLPSPLYAQGPSTGWTGLTPTIDPGRTPTALSTHMADRLPSAAPSAGASIPRVPSGLHHESALGSSPSQPPTTASSDSPALISAVDWWSRNSEAQWRFHKSTLDNMPSSAGGAANSRMTEPRGVLAMSAISRFLSYSTMLCFTERSAPQPPFFHRHLLSTRRNRLPMALSVSRCILAALFMRQSTTEAWAWRHVGEELQQLLEHNRGFLATLNDAHQKAQVAHGPGAPSPDLQEWLERTTQLDGGLELLGNVQALWFYLVVGAFGNTFGMFAAGEAVPARGGAEQYWGQEVLLDAIHMLQSLTYLLASIGLHLQERQWQEKTAHAPNDPQTFLWWGFCETVRRTVLASHALLVLLRYVLLAGEPPLDEHSTAVTLGRAPFPDLNARVPMRAPWETDDWSSVLQLQQPAVANVFEAENSALWRANMQKEQGESANGGMPLTLALFLSQRPDTPESRRPAAKELGRYFQSHDEFTNVCLSVVFGLSVEHTLST